VIDLFLTSEGRNAQFILYKLFVDNTKGDLFFKKVGRLKTYCKRMGVFERILPFFK
jgi:hypothetical protein